MSADADARDRLRRVRVQTVTGSVCSSYRGPPRPRNWGSWRDPMTNKKLGFESKSSFVAFSISVSRRKSGFAPSSGGYLCIGWSTGNGCWSLRWSRRWCRLWSRRWRHLWCRRRPGLWRYPSRHRKWVGRLSIGTRCLERGSATSWRLGHRDRGSIFFNECLFQTVY